ncbi:MAG: hypothetical protein FWD69_10530 [Polyangiaceae bacterium]|nr:hypothetical protein [Polyangiaceae bacterium]
MALDPTRLGAALTNALTSNGAQNNAATISLGNALAAAIVAEFVANATVIPSTMVTPPGGGAVTGMGKVT